ncbi:MAG: heavy-metal-associated domain-containing protein [Thermodesulfobacteriota bacterium]|nr:heavy-metal-associated domain-containing protein [Thermodesulfobacteriota bacterium]
MEKQTLKIANISCGHCTMTIKNELSELEGVSEVDGNVDDKTVTVSWDAPASLDKIKETLKEINYPAQ